MSAPPRSRRRRNEASAAPPPAPAVAPACGGRAHAHGVADLEERLRRDARRVTGARQAILSILQAHAQPLTNKEIFAALPAGECDLATVYRSLHLLEDMGLVTRHDFGDGAARFKVVRTGDHGHHHLICTHCSAVVELANCLVEAWDQRIARENGFAQVTHRLEFFGRCPRCQA